MKRYMLFLYEDYAQNGGMNDFIGDYDTIEEITWAELKTKFGHTLRESNVQNNDINLHVFDIREGETIELDIRQLFEGSKYVGARNDVP